MLACLPFGGHQGSRRGEVAQEPLLSKTGAPLARGSRAKIRNIMSALSHRSIPAPRARYSGFNLEAHLRGELQDPGIPWSAGTLGVGCGCCDLAEISSIKRRHWISQIGMVDHIEGICARLKPPALR